MASVTPFASASLYVGDLNNDVNETTLFEVFSQIGPVASIRVCRDAVTRRSLGYAYVNFHSVTDAERALDTLNFSLVKSRPCRIMWSQRDPSIRKSGVGNIFIKNLDKSIDNKELYDTFSMFGNILSAKIAVSPSDGESLGYGFVHFDSDEAAAKAIERVNGKMLKELTVVVTAFAARGTPSRPAADKTKFTNIYVNGLPDDCTKDKLDAFFSQYGGISQSALQSRMEDGKKFGFVNYATFEEAAAAVAGANATQFEGSTLMVCRAQKKSERDKEMRDRFEQMKRDKANRFLGLNLYVKNLSDETTDAELNADFSKFGPITSAKVMVEEGTGRSKGFGFVCFTTQEDATRAVAEMHNKMIGTKPLYVALAQRKDVRRAQLEQMRQKGMMQQGMYPQGAPMFFGPGGMPGRPGFMPYPPQMMAPNMGRGGYAGPRGPPFMGPAGPRMPQQGFTLVPSGPMIGGAAGRGGARPPRPQGVPVPGAARPLNQQQQPGMLRAPVAGGAPRAPQQQAAGGRLPPGAAGANNVKGGARQEGGSALLPGGGQLTLQTLVMASPEMQKQLIGERLYPLISNKQPEKAGKITGMLLEMENAELLELLDSDEALESKIQEALRVLDEAEGQE